MFRETYNAYDEDDQDAAMGGSERPDPRALFRAALARKVQQDLTYEDYGPPPTAHLDPLVGEPRETVIPGFDGAILPCDPSALPEGTDGTAAGS